MRGTVALFAGVVLLAGMSTALCAQQQQQSPPDKPPTTQHASKAVDPARHSAAPAPKSLFSRRHHWSVEEVKQAQAGLAAAKLYMGRIDGQYGSETRAAMREFQRAHDLPVTGTLSDSVMVLLHQLTSVATVK
jgi:peptidoglycan hydrolase-like protein with peptidoglycan-binding domain